MSFNDQIVNGGFETAALFPWISSGATITSQFSHSGFFAARLAGGFSSSFILQFLPVPPEQSFEFLVSLTRIGAASNPLTSLFIGYLDAANNFLGQGLSVTIPEGNLPQASSKDWLTIYETTDPSPVGTTQAMVLISTLAQAGTSDIVVDDVSLLEVISASTPVTFEWGECTIWADSNALGPGTGTPFDPFTSLQAAIDAATNSATAVTNGMRARCIVLIAANSSFDENVVIPPARHVQLLGLGPWVLGDSALANFASSVPRNVTIQTSQAAENVYLVQGPAFDARPVTVIGTFDNGTSVSTHTNYTDGAIISGDVIFQTVDLIDPFTTIEFQLLNANVVGSIMPSPIGPHQGLLNTYIYNSRINNMFHDGLRIQRMVDSRSDGFIDMDGYSHITNSFINGIVIVGSALADVPPTGIFSSQFGAITWTGPLVLDTSSNFYFVNSGSTLVGDKTILYSLD
ncbi:MAG: hypothetical protein CVU84_12480 [Firmicutes bacterium HGW-Firmicutes-1]|jgi:hypothetical protein|nr:MAG: hypothetical protein CVU84_12480 [Firmicutes bacterium HGW-Firmicutes-1]